MASLRKRVRIKKETGPDQRTVQKVIGWTSAGKSVKSDILELSLSELDNKLRTQLAVRFMEQFGDDTSSSGFRTALREEEELDAENHYDPPEMESETETGEGGESSGYISEPVENFWQYIWRRLDEDYGEEEDKVFYDYIANCLRKWQSYDFSLRDIRNDLKNIRDDLKIWFEELLDEFPSHESDTIELRDNKADIVFYSKKSGVSYEINLGLLEQYSQGQSIKGKREIPLTIKEGYSFLPEQIPVLIHHRREGMKLMAEFLKEKYANYIRNTDFETLKNLRPSKQKDFLDYCKDHGYKKDTSWVSRLVKNKLIKLSFYDEPVSLNIFFSGDEKKIEVISVLKNMIELHIQKGGNPPLTSRDQLVIVKLLCDAEIKERNLRLTYWKELQKEYTEERWIEYGIKGKKGAPSRNQSISDEGLTKLINDIRDELSIPKKSFTKEDIETAKITSDTQ